MSIPRTPTIRELADRAWNNMNDWLEGRRSWTNLGPHSPYTPDVIATMDTQEVIKWASVYNFMERLIEDLPVPDEELAAAAEELAAETKKDSQ